MTPAEITQVLGKCAAYDRRTVGRADVMAWHEILCAVELGDALDAVRRHYRASAEWAMPADILRLSRQARDERQRYDRVRSAALSLPSRFEDDAERAARIARSAGPAREVANAARERRREVAKPERDAWAELRAATTLPAELLAEPEAPAVPTDEASQESQ